MPAEWFALKTADSAGENLGLKGVLMGDPGLKLCGWTLWPLFMAVLIDCGRSASCRPC